jgi:lambda repressor-like predicted transcriptional regulator
LRVTLPFEPLRQYVTNSYMGSQSDERTITSLARSSGMSSGTLFKMIHRGIPLDAADLLAIRGCRRHPSEIWPEWWEAVESEPDCQWCGGLIERPGLYCCDEHHYLMRRLRDRDHKRRIYWHRRLERYRRELS